MPHNPTDDTPCSEGENYDEAMSEEPFDDEEELDAEEAERRITQLITSAEELPGPPLEELAEQVAALMRAALRYLEKLMEGKPHNKVLATQLLLGHRRRAPVPRPTTGRGHELVPMYHSLTHLVPRPIIAPRNGGSKQPYVASWRPGKCGCDFEELAGPMSIRGRFV